MRDNSLVGVGSGLTFDLLFFGDFGPVRSLTTLGDTNKTWFYRQRNTWKDGYAMSDEDTIGLAQLACEVYEHARLGI